MANKKKCCPQCKKRATQGDITVLYNLPKVATADASWAADLERQLAQAARERKRLEDQCKVRQLS